MERSINYLVKYSINYPSGKKWITEIEVSALSESGAISIVKWLKSSKDITILSVIFLSFGGETFRDTKTLGHF